jgi:rare lipoprotein A
MARRWIRIAPAPLLSRLILVLAATCLCAAIGGSAGSAKTGHAQQVGLASWYGKSFRGKRTASGELFDERKLTAAHPTLPMNTLLRVTRLGNDRSVVVRVNDRGPFRSKRIIDLSKEAAKILGFLERGTAKVAIEVVQP